MKSDNENDIYNINKIEEAKKELAIIILNKIKIEPDLLPYILKNMQINEEQFREYIAFKEDQNISFYYEIVMLIKNIVK